MLQGPCANVHLHSLQANRLETKTVSTDCLKARCANVHLLNADKARVRSLDILAPIVPRFLPSDSITIEVEPPPFDLGVRIDDKLVTGNGIKFRFKLNIDSSPTPNVSFRIKGYDKNVFGATVSTSTIGRSDRTILYPISNVEVLEDSMIVDISTIGPSIPRGDQVMLVYVQFLLGAPA